MFRSDPLLGLFALHRSPLVSYWYSCGFCIQPDCFRGSKENLQTFNGEKMLRELFEIATKGDVERFIELFEDPESDYARDPSRVLNARNEDGKSALDLAAMLGRKEMIRELLERGADINSQTKRGVC